MFLLELLGIAETSGNGEAGGEHPLRTLDPTDHLQREMVKEKLTESQKRLKKYISYLIGILLKLAQLDALFQLDPPDRSQVLDVDLSLLDVLEEDLDPSLAVVLTVGHQVDAGTLKVLGKEKRTLDLPQHRFFDLKMGKVIGAAAACRNPPIFF